MKPPLQRIEEFLDAVSSIDSNDCELDYPMAHKTIHKLKAALKEAVDTTKILTQGQSGDFSPSGYALECNLRLNKLISNIADILDGGEK